jgi:glutamine amidotransferase-like uncharacterized protein
MIVALVLFCACCPAEQLRPLRVFMYDGPGASGSNLNNIERIAKSAGHLFTRFKGEQLRGHHLRDADVVVFPGGSGSGEARGIGDEGLAIVRRFIQNGGGYVGICAGAYLGTCKYSWGLKVCNVQTVDSAHWKRGTGDVKVQLTDEGRKIFGEVREEFLIRYANGPLLGPSTMHDLPGFKVLAEFRSELAENGAPTGVMIHTPAIVSGEFGRGRLILLSPHAEHKEQTEFIIVRALNWAAGRDRSVEAK